MTLNGKHQNLLKKALSLNQFELNEQHLQKIDQFIELLLKWNKTINLTAHRTAEEIIEKDICDVLHLNKALHTLALQKPSIIDLGCGAGFNGLILALLNPENTITLLDSDRKKMNFVKQTCRELHLKNTKFILDRVQTTSQFDFDLTITRATWNIVEYLGYAAHYVQNNGHSLFMAGKEEIKDKSEAIDKIGFLRTFAYEYTILPQKYQRKIFFYKKEVPRETV